jgi:ribulose-5-phosphate 4-epimerase/fuculose-1-phosphate aldolase
MLDTICDILKMAYERGWITTRDGNASYKRQNDDFLYITPSGSRKQLLNSENILKLRFMDITSDEPWKYMEKVDDEYQRRNSGLNPSGEIIMHSLLQKIVPENRVVLHLHPTYTIAAMYLGINLQELYKDFVELSRYTKVGPTVDVLPPISQVLGENVVKNFNLDKETGKVDYDIIGLDRHGIVAIGKDALTAFEHVERLEHICKIVLVSGKYKN